jgi:putative transposase
MIDRNHELSVARQAKLLDVSRGSVYYLPKPVSEADLALMRRLDELHLKHPFMGARMLRDQLALAGIHAGRRHIGTLMRRMGIEALAPQPGTSKAAPGHKIYPYLLRNLPIVRANQVWALDTTYIPMAKGFVYLTAVVDVASRLVLAHKVAITLEACHAKEIIEQAFARYGKPEIVVSAPATTVDQCAVSPTKSVTRRFQGSSASMASTLLAEGKSRSTRRSQV